MTRVTIENIGIFKVRKGSRLLDLFIRKNVEVNASCGGRGLCGLCKIRILHEHRKPDTQESALIPRKHLKQGYRLACRYRVIEDIEVIAPHARVPTASSLQRLGLALDLGTTVIKGAAVDMLEGTIIQKAQVYNQQNSIGGDVITRIESAMNGNDALLHKLLVSSIDEVKHKLSIQVPGYTTVVGNPVMLSFYLKKSVRGLARSPFTSKLTREIIVREPPGYIFPVIGGFVGGDTIAGILASGIYKEIKPALYLDLGTNGEVVLVTRKHIYAASTAAGPAFEGMGIRYGSLAVPGAIDHVIYKNGSLVPTTIGNKKPVGICASGLISLLAVLLSHGWLRDDGRLLKTVRLGDIEIVQEDVRKLQLAIGAMHAGIRLLLDKAHVRSTHVQTAVITGEFGARLHAGALVRIGLLPHAIKEVRLAKDLPLAGAVMALRKDRVFKTIRKIKTQCTHLDLAAQPKFPEVFVTSMKMAPWS